MKLKKIRKIKPDVIFIVQTAYALVQEINKFIDLFDD